LGVAAVSLWEVTLLVERGRLALDRQLLPWLQAALNEARVELLPMTPEIVSTAHQIRGALDGDPGDRLIAATALAEGAKLVTKDERITDSGVVPVIW
jgi:PIN domain nuclease of toxin-antitoxin system